MTPGLAPSLEVRIPISPEPHYFNRVRLIARSVRDLYPEAIVRVTVGADREPEDLYRTQPWSNGLIEWAWVDRREFAAWAGTQHPYVATMMERFRPPFAGRFVLMLDADVIAIRSFDELFAYEDSLCAIMAHAAAFAGDDKASWKRLFAGYGLPEPRFDYELSGWPAMHGSPAHRQYSPLYLNTGVVAAGAGVLESLYAQYAEAIAYVRNESGSYFVEQIALSLAVARARVPVCLLPMRYNFPNQPEFERRYPGELENVRLLHFLRTDAVDRRRDFEDAASIRRLVSRTDLAGSNECLRRRVAELSAEFEP